jgi:hypothetical protein
LKRPAKRDLTFLVTGTWSQGEKDKPAGL